MTCFGSCSFDFMSASVSASLLVPRLLAISFRASVSVMLHGLFSSF